MANRPHTNGTHSGLEDRLHQFAQGYDFGALLNIPSSKLRRDIRPPSQTQVNDALSPDQPILLEDRVRQLAGRYDFGVLMKGVSTGTPFPDEISNFSPTDADVPSFLPKPDPIVAVVTPKISCDKSGPFIWEPDPLDEPVRTEAKRQPISSIVMSAVVATVISLVINLGVVRYGIGSSVSAKSAVPASSNKSARPHTANVSGSKTAWAQHIAPQEH